MKEREARGEGEAARQATNVDRTERWDKAWGESERARGRLVEGTGTSMNKQNVYLH